MNFLFFKMSLLGSPYFDYPIIILIALICSAIVSYILRGLIHQVITLASEKLHTDVTKFNFLKNGMSIIVYTFFTILACYSIPPLRHMGDTIFAGAGIFAAVIGFASQQAFSNIISGIFIVIFKPFSVGDTIRVGNDPTAFGTVEDITLRHVIIKSLENRRLIIPNSIISSQMIVNSTITDAKVCTFIEITLDHKTNTDVGMQILREEIEKHFEFVDTRSENDIEENKPKANVIITNIIETGVQIRGYGWAKDANAAFKLKVDVLKALKDRYDATGIEFAKAPRLALQATPPTA
jgi:small conductance mechanosensitive channel